MRCLTLLASVVGLAVPLLTAVSANAQATRTWVSGVGDDVNPCSRTAPCKTFAGAISKTAARGEINCLDPGGFGAVTITKAITISCEGVTAGVLTNAANAINVSAGVNDVVHLKGLDIEGLGTATTGIKINSAAAVIIDNCVIRGFGAANGLGIQFAPSTNNARLMVTNTLVANNGNAVSGGGIQVLPAGAATNAEVSLDRVTVFRNFAGVAAVGIGGASEMMIANSRIDGNLSTGVIATGAGATVRMGSSTIANNQGAATSGNVLSYGNNQINSNNPDTVPGLVPGGLH
jgi:hypothetical protein